MIDRISASPRALPRLRAAHAARTVVLVAAWFIVSHAAPNAQAQALQTVAVKIPGTTVKIDLVRIPGGTITLPDPKAPGGKRQVKIAPLLVARTELPWEAYDAWTTSKETPPTASDADAIAKPSHSYIPPDRGFGHIGYPTISVSHLGAANFCKWLSQVTGKKFRLPTTAEFSYAALAGAKPPAKPMPASELTKYAWVAENSGGKTHPVAKKLPNKWGLYDMLGNAGEWCTELNGTPVLCGGSFQDKAAKVSWASRAPYHPDWQMEDPQFPKSKWWYSDGPMCGLRVVCEP